MVQRRIPYGAQLLSPKRTCQKFDRQKSWLWQLLKDEPDFPRPIYINGRPLWLEHELDAHIARKAGA